ncbi:MAG: hypothetical protein GY736_24375 [Sphingomonas sp.]|uniref:hypothetical protein n=1 Tax=Sphingomonas sp. TaxID=28214 RepID=UPI002584B896|nr:hypothetical protein [Sphingomonas sp.]MCP4029431.1 hypothetical protein [Sphingomonas sp.]
MQDGSTQTQQRPVGRRWLALGGALLIIVVGVAAITVMIGRRSAVEGPAERIAVAPSIPASFSPPPDSAIPDGPAGAAIRRGRQLFLHTRTNAADHVGTGLSCSN